MLSQTDFRTEFLHTILDGAMIRSIATMCLLMLFQFVIGIEGFSTVTTHL